jgi:hypothetical protein
LCVPLLEAQAAPRLAAFRLLQLLLLVWLGGPWLLLLLLLGRLLLLLQSVDGQPLVCSRFGAARFVGKHRCHQADV